VVEMKIGRAHFPQLRYGVGELFGAGTDEVGSTRDSDGIRSELLTDLGQRIEESRMATPAKNEGTVSGQENQ
jgi:hypothetical protein